MSEKNKVTKEIVELVASQEDLKKMVEDLKKMNDVTNKIEEITNKYQNKFDNEINESDESKNNAELLNNYVKEYFKEIFNLIKETELSEKFKFYFVIVSLKAISESKYIIFDGKTTEEKIKEMNEYFEFGLDNDEMKIVAEAIDDGIEKILEKDFELNENNVKILNKILN